MTTGSDEAAVTETPWFYRISWNFEAAEGTFWSPSMVGGWGVVSSSPKSPVNYCPHCQGHPSLVCLHFALIHFKFS